MTESCMAVCFTEFWSIFHYEFTTNLVLSLSVKEFRKLVIIWQSYGQPYSRTFIPDTVQFTV